MLGFLTAHGRQIDQTKPDGNCLFRSLSKQLCNNSECHGMLREMITEYVESNPKLFQGWTVEHLSVEEHTHRMKTQGTWGSHLEIKATATLFSKTIYVASDTLVAGKCTWEAFSPFSVSGRTQEVSKFPVTNHKHWLEIAYTGHCHYDAVVPLLLEMPLKPPALTGQTYSVAELL